MKGYFSKNKNMKGYYVYERVHILFYPILRISPKNGRNTNKIKRYTNKITSFFYKLSNTRKRRRRKKNIIFYFIHFLYDLSILL